MTIKCSVYIAASVDGFIATPDGGVEWLEKPEYSAVPMEGLSYDEFISTVDALVMGRNTFEKVLTFGAWPYEGTPVVVLSSAELAIPEHLGDAVRHESGEPKEIVERLAKAGMRHLYIDGGVTIQRFLKDKLINELTITRIPVLLGAGLPLFGDAGPEQKLKLSQATASDNGFVQERYIVENVV
ncbi:dihydrofolate reductase family protein [Halomonas salipaludis]|uniref:Deaminase n=1 Tax=Halomonas salipaludis TaxID=2032625 RepID=A0A2A2EQM4_9GAMM|nr:dihydrofolate reductase family protein [Halomonas salipaludis]PAU75416.1 deaminase [Halomonas salipaludis]